ncbi:Dfp1/Him1, central region-domain-containing protein [Vararia minispora EC-137]|uniref:Dfp1/Him1, central region-domain-containing protein n=1 Tax=Vararia minispora EC-137 TaxID=1314806 RepID=A0ACB8QGF0_9AGAM|nr:Dfp1/Him1, central region-domain-containing protein [Vararia minispora EC-137]
MAAAVSRRPGSGSLPRQYHHLSTVPSPQQVPLSRSVSVASSLKRPRSPDYSRDPASLKRQKAVAVPRSPAPAASQQIANTFKDDDHDPRKERRRQERLDRERVQEEWRIKYTKAFPTFSFYFDSDVGEDDPALKERLEQRILSLGGSVEDFFSKDGLSHFITNRLLEDIVHSNKENHSRPSRSQSLLKSPIRLRGVASPKPADDLPTPAGSTLLQKAKSFNLKIWNVQKLESVLDRCHAPAVSTALRPAAGNGTLQRLLESERLHGTTERDPTQKRLNYQYFNKNTCFVLIEDLREELATIHAAEFPIRRLGRDGQSEGDWPVLYCHPDTRGPFNKPDETEFRRARRQLQRDEQQDRELMLRHEQRWERERRRAALAQAEAERLAAAAQSAGDLRRSVSMTNLRRRALSGAEGTLAGDTEFDEVGMESANASGYLRSQYVAASGNSVSVTSTTGTTTSAGNSLRSAALSASLRGMQKQEVVTSLKVGGKAKGDMGPPAELPQKMLRKSKSTTTIRLPRREEGSKPGFCENCRQRYPDFEEHIASKRHRKWASNDANFEQLDIVIDRIRRPVRPEWLRRHRAPAPVLEPDSSPVIPLSTLLRDVRSSSEVSDYLPQPQVDYKLTDVAAEDSGMEL